MNTVIFRGFKLFLVASITLFVGTISVCAQSTEVKDSIVLHKKLPGVYVYRNGNSYEYKKPAAFNFITGLPGDASNLLKQTFKRESIPALLWLGGGTVALMLVDQKVADAVKHFSTQIHFRADEKYKHVLDLKMGKTDVSIFKVPKNINTGLYQAGQGFPGLLIGAGLFTYGKITHDYRALSTASQLAETFILMGISTQLLKRISGRQSPSHAIESGGQWHFLPSFKSFQQHTPNYDAFPSGHLATLISTITVLADNYDDRRYIRPVGYGLIALVGAAMINTDVHWISDYPLALGLGYLSAKVVIHRARKQIETGITHKHEKLACNFNVRNGQFVPGIIWKL